MFILICLAIFTFVALFISRYGFGSLISPCLILIIIWDFIIGSYSLSLLDYPFIYCNTSIIISVTLSSFLLACITLVLARKTPIKKVGCNYFSQYVSKRKKSIEKCIYVLLIISLIGVIGEYLLLFFTIGTLSEIFNNISKIRIWFTSGKLDFGIFDYLSMFAFPAAILGGIYIATISHRKIFAYFPMISIIIFALPVTARMNILWGLLFYINSFILSRVINQKRILKINFKALIFGTILVLVLIIGFNFLWQSRLNRNEYPLFEMHASKQFILVRNSLIGTTNSSKVGQMIFGSMISNYTYLTLSFAHLNEYLESPYEIRNNELIGSATFAGWWRLIKKTGINIESDLLGGGGKKWEVIPTGPGTLMSDVFYDFGLIGLIIFFYILGFASSILYLSILKNPSLTKIGILSVLYIMIEMSWFGSMFNHTVPVFAILIILIIGCILDLPFLKLIKTQ